MQCTRLFATAAAIIAVLCAGCDSSSSGAAVTPESSPTPTLSDISESPSDPVPSYLQGLTEREREAYKVSLSTYERFSARQAEIMQTGRATPAAKAFYRANTAAWMTFWATLRQRDADGIHIEGKGRVIRVRPGSIRLDKSGAGTVALRVCGVADGVKAFKNGKEIQQPTPTPHIVNVAMVKLDGESKWRVLSERVGPRC
jgi:hypothetical protein